MGCIFGLIDSVVSGGPDTECVYCKVHWTLPLQVQLSVHFANQVLGGLGRLRQKQYSGFISEGRFCFVFFQTDLDVNVR